MDARDELIARAEKGRAAEEFLASPVAEAVLITPLVNLENQILTLRPDETVRFTTLSGARSALVGLRASLHALMADGEDAQNELQGVVDSAPQASRIV